MHQLIHNGVIVPEIPEFKDLHILINGKAYLLTARQAEMALAWAKKVDTPYVKDPVFQKNFLKDFSAALGLETRLTIQAIDFTPIIKLVLAEREGRAKLTPEERKQLALDRKARREVLKEKYGFAIVNGERTELANYIVEPSGIFMGRGEHPLRGCWKQGAQQNDITLNLSPDAPKPIGHWKEIIWEPEYMWIARWTDKLSGKIKYVWLHDSSPIKQAREARKFDKASLLHEKLSEVRAQIESDLADASLKKREIATACFLIDALGLRVGDEKDPDEADTVGATTLRPEHIKIHADGIVEFHFLGKDSVEWHKKVELPEVVRKNLAELAQNARPSVSVNGKNDHPTRSKPQLFPGIDSRDVNAYLSGILPGLTAKVFRTHHATKVVEKTLEAAQVSASDPEYKKWEATVLANLEAARLCNHTKMAPKNLAERRKKYEQRLKRATERVESYNDQIKELKERLKVLREEAKEKKEAAQTPKLRKRVNESFKKKIEKTQANLEALKSRYEKAQHALGKLKVQKAISTKHYIWNLGTSQKSYIDPRVYYNWGKQVGYDVLGKYYSKTLQRKFAWVKADAVDSEDGATEESAED